jgi:hypothetical protein
MINIHKMRSLLLCIAAVVLCFPLYAQEHYRTMTKSQQVRTLQVNVAGQQLGRPIIELNGNESILIQFDEMSHNIKNYSYSIHHCNADWTLSNLTDMEAVDGMPTAYLTDNASSFNTTFLFTHYTLSFPNANTRMKVSGNYMVKIYEDNDPDKLVAIACFSVVEPKIAIQASLRGNADNEFNGRYQQLEFTIDNSQFPVRDVFSELKVTVRQNDRIDNQVTDVKPTFTASGLQSYVHNPALIFEGGNEYRRFDCSSIYTYGVGVDNVRFISPYYHVTLFPDAKRAGKAYGKDDDVNGRFVVNLQNAADDQLDADYVFVHFSLPTDQPFFEGSLYLLGDMTENMFTPENRLEYNGQHNAYEKTLLLKQGGYNYQYVFVPKGGTKGSLQQVEGSYWQTSNEYDIYVYYKGWNDRYDRLVGVKMIE